MARGVFGQLVYIDRSHQMVAVKLSSEDTIRAELDGNMCRCTGYHNIVKAVQAGARAMGS